MAITRAHFILYVRDQAASTDFYRRVLLVDPSLDVPGMSEFELPGGALLGLMPERGVVRLLGRGVDPAQARGAPRAELYLMVDDPRAYHARALASGAKELSGPADRDWHHHTAYSADPDGHIIAFASDLRDPERP
jgi:catechol 2,3-dioxygenase-like lactoylglutathione lyase family enzyme